MMDQQNKSQYEFNSRRNMIKQSEICNFVYLIKALKRQVKNSSPARGSCYEKGKIVISSRKNSLMRTAQSKKIHLNKQQLFETTRIGNSAVDLSNLDVNKRQVSRKKNVYPIECEQLKNTSSKFLAVSLHKQGDSCGESFLKYLPVQHKRSNTSQLKREKQNKQICESSHNSQKTKILERVVKTRWRPNLGRKDKAKFTEAEKVRRKFDTTFQHCQPRNPRLSVCRQSPDMSKDQDKDRWAIDAWEQPLDLGEECFQ